MNTAVYNIGGYTGASNTAATSRLSFSNATTNAVAKGNLTSAIRYATGVAMSDSFDQAVYSMGGDDGSKINTIQRVAIGNDTAAYVALTGTLSVGKRAAGIGYDGRGGIYLCGGKDSSDTIVSTIEAFQINASASNSVAKAALPVAVETGGAGYSKDCMYNVGGWTGGGTTDATAKYTFSIATTNAIAKGSLAISVYIPFCVLVHDALDQAVYVLGGSDNGGTYRSEIQRMSESNDTTAFATLTGALTAIRGFGGSAYDGNGGVYVCGGQDGSNYLSSTECFQIAKSTANAIAKGSLPATTSQHGAGFY